MTKPRARARVRARAAASKVAEDVILAPHDLRGGELTVGDRKLAVLSFSIGGATSVKDEGRGALSRAEREVVVLILAGHTNAEIADARRTSIRTVANQVASIFRKLGVSSRRSLLATLLVRPRDAGN